MEKKTLDILKGNAAGISPEEILSSPLKADCLILSPQERGCPMILGSSLRYYSVELRSTLSSAASAGLKTLFKPLRLFSDQEYADFKKKYTVPPAEKIDYTHKPRSTTGTYLDFVSKTSKTKPDVYDPNIISALLGLSITRKKPGEYHGKCSEIDHLSSSNYLHKK